MRFFYALVEKGTERFLPETGRSGYTFTELEDPATSKKVPRLFHSKRAAAVALGWWKKGYHEPVYDTGDDYGIEFTPVAAAPVPEDTTVRDRRAPLEIEIRTVRLIVDKVPA